MKLRELGGTKLEEDDVRELEASFGEEEIKEAVCNCGVEKSPGPDGFGG